MTLVLLESPFAGKTEDETQANIVYGLNCMLDCFTRGEAPFASHLIYTRVLDDTDPVQRAQGIEAGLAWGACAVKTVAYTDRGISNGMRMGIERAEREGRPVEYRKLYEAVI